MPVDPSPTEGAAEPNTPTPDEGTTPAAAESSSSDANQIPADSSTADGDAPESGAGDKKPKSILDAVDAALEGGKSDADSPTADKGTKDDKGESDPDKPEGDSEDDKPPFHEHPAWKRVIGQKKEAEAKVAEYEESHQAITRLENFLTEKNLTVEEFNTSLQISAAMRNDPHAALKMLMPYVQALQEVTGTTLPSDIQQALDDGLVSETYARELAQARAGQTLSSQRLARTEQRNTQDRERREREQTQGRMSALKSAATAWETERSSKDPDYAKKSALFRSELEVRWRRGEVPQDEAAMRKQCDDAMKAVESQLRGFMPKKPQTAPTPSIGAAGTAAPAAKPKSMLDVVNLAVGG